jgi:hypothetical protein
MTALRSVPAVSVRPRRPYRGRIAGAGGFLLLLALLFTAYLRLSQTYPENSDEANILLMASDLARGNLDLSGWTVSDVPFITTELPEIALLVRLFGLHLSTAHIAAALTYTVVVGIAMLLAASHGRRPLVRMTVVLALMLAPQTGIGVFVLLFSVGHIGTAAPVMLTWLVIDRGQAGPHPGRVAAVGGLLLAWALLADPLVLVIGVIPVLVVAAVRRGRLELSLPAAAGAAYLAAWCGRRLLRAAGGYTQPPVPWLLDPVSTWYAHSRTVAHGLLEMFGAFFLPGQGSDGLSEVLAASRLACVALAAAGALTAARGFLRRDADLVSQLLLTGMVANLAAYIPSSLASHTALNAREFAPVLPFAAVLAARALGDRLGDQARPGRIAGNRPGGRRVLAAALAVLLGWYAFGLLRESRMPAAPDPFTRLEAYLEAHHLRYGIGGYWDSSVITVDTGGAVTIRAVTAGCAQPYAWESQPAWYDPARHTATFLLTSADPGYFSRWVASPAARRRLAGLVPADGAPLRPGAGYQVQAYRGNLLAALPRAAGC